MWRRKRRQRSPWTRRAPIAEREIKRKRRAPMDTYPVSNVQLQTEEGRCALSRTLPRSESGPPVFSRTAFADEALYEPLVRHIRMDDGDIPSRD